MAESAPEHGPGEPRRADLIIPPTMRQTRGRTAGRAHRFELKPVGWPGYLCLTLLSLLVFAPVLTSDVVWSPHDSATRTAFQTMDSWTDAWTIEAIRQHDPLTLSLYFAEGWLPLPMSVAHHAINFALHLLAAVLLLKVMEALRTPGALPSALVFAIHPAVIPTVFWSGYREEIVATLVVMAALFFFIQNRHPRDFFLALALSCLAFLIHPAAYALPVVMALCIFYTKEKTGLADYNRVLPIACLALFLGVWTQAGAAVFGPAADHGRLALGSQRIFFLLEQTLLPGDSAVFHRFTAGKSFRVGATNEILPFAFYLPFYILCLFNLRHRWGRGGLLGLTAFLGFATPAVFRPDFFIDGQLANSSAAFYMAVPFLIALVVSGMSGLFLLMGGAGRSLWKIGVTCFLLLQLAIVAPFTYALGDTSAFWQKTSERWPRSWQAKLAYLETVTSGEQYTLPADEVIQLLESTLALNPALEQPRRQLARLYEREGQNSNALREYRRVLRETDPPPAFLQEAADFFDSMGLRWEASNVRERLTATRTN